MLHLLKTMFFFFVENLNCAYSQDFLFTELLEAIRLRSIQTLPCFEKSIAKTLHREENRLNPEALKCCSPLWIKNNANFNIINLNALKKFILTHSRHVTVLNISSYFLAWGKNNYFISVEKKMTVLRGFKLSVRGRYLSW